MSEREKLVAFSKRDYTAAQLALIKRTVAVDTDENEFSLFIEVARRAGLDPFRRQIHALVFSKGNKDKRKMAIVVGIDGFRAVANRSGNYRPDDHEPEIHYDEKLKDTKTNPLGIERAVVRCFKRIDNEWHPVIGVAYWQEYVPLEQDWKTGEDGRRSPVGDFYLKRTSPWFSMPRIMIVKSAEAQAIRRGWPEDLSGLFEPSEFDRTRAIDASDEVAAFEADDRLIRAGAKDTLAIQWAPDLPIEMVPLGKMADACMAHIQAARNADDLRHWADTNRGPLREFWAKSQSEALAVKRAHEKRARELTALPKSEKPDAP